MLTPGHYNKLCPACMSMLPKNPGSLFREVTCIPLEDKDSIKRLGTTVVEYNLHVGCEKVWEKTSIDHKVHKLKRVYGV